MLKLSIVIVGAGRAGKDLHVDAFNAQPETKVEAICDADGHRLEDAVREKAIPNAYASLGDALNHHKPDIVSICSPPQFHLEHVKQAMEAGAHVLLEKPMAISIQEADQMRQHQLQAGVKFCVVHNFKFQPGVQQALRMVHNGEIGELLHIERTWMQNGYKDRMISNPKFWCHSLAGGRWAETLPHDIYIPYQFVGEFKLVSVATRKIHSKWPWLLADEVVVVLEHKTGYIEIRMSANVEDRLYKYMMVYGSKGVLFSDSASTTRLPLSVERAQQTSLMHLLIGGKGLVHGALRRAKRLIARSPVTPIASAGAQRRTESEIQGHDKVVEKFIQHIKNDSPPPTSWEEARFTMKLAEEVGRAIQDKVAKEVSKRG